MIAILDYDMGNLRSVSKALEHVGSEVLVTNNPKDLKNASALVVPGVGAFGDCVKTLTNCRLIDAIKDFIASGRPYLGLCLGMQILLEASEEAPGINGLGIIKGKVKRFSTQMELKIPHMGWNKIKVITPHSRDTLFQSIPNNSYMYFVHSYYADPEDKSVIGTETDYGITFCSAICKDNIFATQFHPEKSQHLGLQILKNFGGLC